MAYRDISMTTVTDRVQTLNMTHNSSSSTSTSNTSATSTSNNNNVLSELALILVPITITETLMCAGYDAATYNEIYTTAYNNISAAFDNAGEDTSARYRDIKKRIDQIYDDFMTNVLSTIRDELKMEILRELRDTLKPAYLPPSTPEHISFHPLEGSLQSIHSTDSVRNRRLERVKSLDTSDDMMDSLVSIRSSPRLGASPLSVSMANS